MHTAWAMYAIYATINTNARLPNMLGPFVATTGTIRQNTPIGLSLIIAPMICIETSLALSINFANGSPFSPAIIVPKPKNKAITITCSIVALLMGEIILLGKIFTNVSIKPGASAAEYSSPVVEICTK
ncbi:hypothetical protein SDC9_157365 [bioreactor metagenome]|uniref:Uncharacterized protein n=1 Tax=bioreactor metagenome TaxID=1076179 RepID=A0A645F939_9ZZZZ